MPSWCGQGKVYEETLFMKMFTGHKKVWGGGFLLRREGRLSINLKRTQTSLSNFTSTINQQMHLYNFHLKHFKTTKNHSDMFRPFQIIIREFRRSLLKLLHIHDLVRFCKQGVVAAYHVV